MSVELRTIDIAMTTQSRIEQKLQDLHPVHLEVINESHMHNVPEGSESHFKVLVVTEEFVGKNLIARHRRVNGLLADELQASIHALSLHAKTPDEWFASNAIKDSPECLGGSAQEAK
jgi:BolA family transcriptional regulator, general stress-responsive regulator